MIASLFFCLIAAGFFAEVASKTRYERLFSFLLLGSFAALVFMFLEGRGFGLTQIFEFHWIDTSLMKINIDINTNAATCKLVAPFMLLTGLSILYNTFYTAEVEKLRLNGLLLMNLAAVILVICSQNFMQLLAAVCIADVLCLFMINEIEGKRRYVFYNLLADMGLFTLFALIWKQTGSINLLILSEYHRPGQHPELTVGLLLFCAFIKSGMFLFQGGFLNIAGLTFNRIFAVSYCATPLVGILLLIKTYPLLTNVGYVPTLLQLFGGLTLLWGFVGVVSIDNLKDKALYFNLMFYALIIGLLSWGLSPILELLPLFWVTGSLLNVLWMMIALSASNELLVSNMGAFAKPLKFVFLWALVLAFILLQVLLAAADTFSQLQSHLWIFTAILIVAYAHVLYQIFLGKTNADERVWAFLKNPPLLYLLSTLALGVFIVWKNNCYNISISYAYVAFLLFLFAGPLRLLNKLYEVENIQEADWFDDMYETLLIAPVKILGRILWLTIDFLIIERTIISSLSGGTTLLVRLLDRMHTGTWIGGTMYVLAGLLITAALVYVKVNR